MRSRKPAVQGSLVYGAALAVVCAVGMDMLLSALSAPPEIDQRVSALQQQIDSTKRALRSQSRAGAPPADAICAGAGEAARRTLRETIGAQALANKLDLTNLEIGPDAQTTLGETLIPFRIRLEVQGSYEAAIGALEALSHQRPVVFIDTVDLVSKTSSVALKLSGRFYCSAGT